ncbi:unnamed protein product [Paramecium octaurelia]|uniref:Uncharacterized protein n=1 Tax=Paramecium octaurelia TaxID=43137 RepID=A0A8S1XBX9_PAROT|nr:unnamed protein product [Paramecium octaurelia]
MLLASKELRLQKIKQLKNLNQNKKKGGIFELFYNDDGEFVAIENCTFEPSSTVTQEQLKLEKLPYSEIQKLQGFMPYNKSISSVTKINKKLRGQTCFLEQSFPYIPNKAQFWPITILRNMSKFM